MNTKLLLLVLIIAGFSSCSTAYKAGQTPDDVYYSPVRPQNDYVKTETDEDKNVYNNNTPNSDNTIRTRSHNRRWRRYNDYDYNYPYGNQYPPVYVDPKTGYALPAPKQQPRKVNLGGYKKPADTTATTSKTGITKGGNTNPSNTTAPVRTFPKQNNRGSSVGNFIRQVFTTSGSNNNNADNSSADRLFNETKSSSNNNNSNNGGSNNSSGSNNNSGSNNSSSSSSSSAPVRTFDKK